MSGINSARNTAKFSDQGRRIKLHTQPRRSGGAGAELCRKMHNSYVSSARVNSGKVKVSQVKYVVYLGSVCTAVLIGHAPAGPPATGFIYEGAIGQPR